MSGHIHVRRYASECYLPGCVIERHTALRTDAITDHGRSQLLPIMGNLNNDRYIRKMLELEVVSFLQGILEAIFQQNNIRLHAVGNV